MNEAARTALRAARDALQGEIEALQRQAQAIDAMLGDAVLLPAPAPRLTARPSPQPSPASGGSRRSTVGRGGGEARPAGRKGPARRIDRDAVRRLFDQGRDDDAIAREVGATPLSVRYVRLQLGLKRERRAAAPPPAPLPRRIVEPPRAPRPEPVTLAMVAAPPAEFETVETVAPVIAFLKSRDYDVKALLGGGYQVDRKAVDRAGLIEIANRAREAAKKPPFRYQAW